VRMMERRLGFGSVSVTCTGRNADEENRNWGNWSKGAILVINNEFMVSLTRYVYSISISRGFCIPYQLWNRGLYMRVRRERFESPHSNMASSAKWRASRVT